MIIAVARFVYLTTMSERPTAQRFERLPQRMAKRRDRVLDPDRGRWQDGARDKPVPLEALERVGQRLVGNTVQPSLDLVEPGRLGADRDEDQNGPLIRDLIENGPDQRHLRQSSLRNAGEFGILGYI